VADEEAEAERVALVSRLFALLTAKFEDGAGIAADCQGRRPPSELLERARDLISLSDEITTLTAAALALVEQSDQSGGDT